MSLTLFLVFVIATIIIIYFLIKRSGENSRGKGSSERTDSSGKSKPSTIHFSDDFKVNEMITTRSREHNITTILMYKENTSVWVCPICETENTALDRKCCVCHHVR